MGGGMCGEMREVLEISAMDCSEVDEQSERRIC